MFTPVRGEQFAQFDEETIQLYRRREAEPFQTRILARMARPQRNYVPVPLDPNGQIAKEMEPNHLPTFAKFSFALIYFSKY